MSESTRTIRGAFQDVREALHCASPQAPSLSVRGVQGASRPGPRPDRPGARGACAHHRADVRSVRARGSEAGQTVRAGDAASEGTRPATAAERRDAKDDRVQGLHGADRHVGVPLRGRSGDSAQACAPGL